MAIVLRLAVAAMMSLRPIPRYALANYTSRDRLG